MGRADESDDAMPYGLWLGAVARATNSKRGQQTLRDLEQALLAIPDKRLAYEHVAHEGDVCAVGAYAAYKETAGMFVPRLRRPARGGSS